MGPAEIVFGCLPDPEWFERACEGDFDRNELYHCASDILTYLVTAFGGRDRILAAFDDPLLKGLLDILDEAGITPRELKDNDAHKYRCWSDGLRMLAWKQLGNGTEAGRRYTPKTRRVLEYLRWVVLGRKDVTCMVRKPWSSKNPETLSWGAPTDLRRLFAGGFSDRCSYCSAFGARHQCVSCQPRGDEHHESGTVYCNERCLRYHSPVHAASCKETRGLIRRVQLFQDAFNTYLTNIECPVSDEGHSQPVNTIPHHTIAVLSTASGLEFAFDPTAAQFGWKEYLSPWSVYRERRVDLLYDQEVARPLSPACALTRQEARNPGRFDWDSARAAQEIVEDAKARFRNNTLECGALDCSDAEFQAGRRALRVLHEVWVERWASRKGLL
ncbi:hypothetical protein Daus18300_006561 [Diaporthe australafricana]|uniref:MYND-type zinc finger protein samB n=1 Tax=Diaporthe australafricana TaxID=127596 RepID=A0ABR3WTF2_9PEZI